MRPAAGLQVPRVDVPLGGPVIAAAIADRLARVDAELAQKQQRARRGGHELHHDVAAHCLHRPHARLITRIAHQRHQPSAAASELAPEIAAGHDDSGAAGAGMCGGATAFRHETAPYIAGWVHRRALRVACTEHVRADAG